MDEATGGAVSSQWFGEVGAQVGKTKGIEVSDVGSIGMT